MKRKFISFIITLTVLVIVGATNGSTELFDSETNDNSNNNNYNNLEKSNIQLDCNNDSGSCYSAVISKIVDGDTVHLTNGDSVKFTLVVAPEINIESGVQFKKYLESICPVGKTVHVDEDDGQLQKSYGRTIGMVYCEDDLTISLN